MMDYRIQQTNKVRTGTSRVAKPVAIQHTDSVKTVLQTKLKIGQPNDRYEQEADRVAVQVMRIPSPQRSLSDSNTPKTNYALAHSSNIQRICASCAEDEEIVQAKTSTGMHPELSPDISSNIQSLRSGGQPLSGEERHFFEPRFGADFSAVRIHRDMRAARVAQSINARAFTVGRSVVFGAGEYSANSLSGKKLLAHELTHVIQQRAANVNAVQRQHTCENDPATAPSMACNIAATSPAGASLDIFFNIGSDALSTDAIDALHNLIRNWYDAGGTDIARVDGFASCDGSPALNWPLSCKRAVTVAHELIHPSDPALPGINPAFVDIFADGETDRFSATSLSPNRRAMVAIGDNPHPNPTPTPTLPSITPCTSLPRQIFNRGACGGGTDFTHHDFQSLAGASTAERAAVWEADNLTLDFQLRNRMRLELGILAGSEGWRMVDHFAGGSGSQLTHGSGSVLGRDALASGTFSTLKGAVIRQIEGQLASMHAAGAIDCDAIALSAASVPAVSFGFGDSNALKGIIGGTQELRIRITHFSVSPGSRSYNLGLQYLICDDFGVDTADLYSLALVAFWVLQHRRTGHLPFINELDLPTSETGTY